MLPSLKTKSSVFIFTLLLHLLFIFPLQAQQSVYFPFYEKDINHIQALAQSQRQLLKSIFVVPEGVSKSYRKDYLSLTEGIADRVYSSIRYQALQDTLINPFVQRIFQQVLATNKLLPATQLFVIRSHEENAYAFGDRVIFFNVGLLSKLDNESQVAFIICHELAHLYLEHMQKNVKEYFDTFYSQDFQKEAKKIAKGEYNQYAKMNSLILNASLNKLYHNRIHEKQADSLGYILMANTGFDLNQAYTTLQLLDKIDHPYSSDEIDFNRHFGCSEFKPVSQNSSPKKSSIFAVAPDTQHPFELSDTLKTHPDCKKRMKFIEELAQSSHTLHVDARNDQPVFERIKMFSRFEAIQSWYDASRYDRALFEVLLLLQENPKNTYLQSMVLLCFYQLKEHMRKHRYAEMVSRSSALHPSDFNQLIETLHNLNLSDFQPLSRCFYNNYPLNAPADEYSLAAAYAYNALIEDQLSAASIRKQYLDKYPQGRLKHLFQ